MNATLHVEHQILATCLNMPGAVREVASIIKKPDVFATPANQKIYAVMLALNADGADTDLISVNNELQAAHGLYQNDPAGWLTLLTSIIPEDDTMTGNVARSCYWLISEATRRVMMKVYGQALSELQLPGSDPLLLIENVRGRMDEVTNRLHELRDTPFSGSLHEAVKMAEAAAKQRDPITGIRTGLDDLDMFTKGLHPATMTIWAARPAMGKTAQLCQAVYNIGHRQQIPVAVFSLEMPRVQLARRLLAIDTGTKNAHVLSGLDSWGDPINIGKLFDSAGRMGDSPLYIYDNIYSLDHIIGKATQLVMSQGVKAIFIDYIGLIETDGRDDDRARVGRASRALKKLSVRLNVPVVPLAQLSRTVESRPSRRPQMSDLRDSGSLEQDADNIIFLFRPGYYFKEDENGETIDQYLLKNIVAKNRNGSTHNDEEAINFFYDKSTNQIGKYVDTRTMAPHEVSQFWAER